MTAFEITSGLVDHHVTTDIPDIVEVNADACLAALVSAERAPGEQDRARRRLRQIGRWFEGNPRQVAALIDALAGMDPVRRNRRKAVLVEAWADLLTD